MTGPECATESVAVSEHSSQTVWDIIGHIA
jgi:hypothetical protein